MPCASNVGIKQGGRFPEKLFISFQTLDRLVVDVKDVQNCRQEDDFASSITFHSTPFENDNVTQKPSTFHSVEDMLFVFDGNVTLLIPSWNCDFDRPLGLRNSFQSSFPNTRFKEAVCIVQ